MQNTEVVSALLQLAETRYEQIIEVNLTEGTTRILWSKYKEASFHLDSLWNENKLCTNDMKVLRKLHDANYVRQHLANKASLSYKYREKISPRCSEWKQIEVIRGEAYSESNVVILMFIKSIEDSFGREYKAKREAEKAAVTDSLTGYLNRLAFDRFKTTFDGKKHSIGVAFIDLNCLKSVNDTEGHAAGDNYIKECCNLIDKSFTGCDKYRIGGDEFVVLCQDSTFERFKLFVYKFNSAVSHYSKIPICAIGYDYAECGYADLDELLSVAEAAMYRDKENVYLKYNIDRRKNNKDRRSGNERRCNKDRRSNGHRSNN